MTPKCPDCKRDQDDCCCKCELESLRQQLADALNEGLRLQTVADDVRNAYSKALLDTEKELRRQLETERMRNVACDVVAMADTPTSAEEARKMLPDYRSAALESVIRRVDECIALRQQLATAQEEITVDEQRVADLMGDVNHLGHRLAASQKREVMLRGYLEKIAFSRTGKCTDLAQELFDREDLASEALAATADLDGLILCHAEPVGEVKRHTGSLKDMAIIVWTGKQPEEGTKLYSPKELK